MSSREEGGFGSKLTDLDPLHGKILWQRAMAAAMRQRGGGSIEGGAVAARVFTFLASQAIIRFKIMDPKKWVCDRM